MTDLDRQYLDILNKILVDGVEKETRSGKVKSIFGEQIKINLKDGFPLLTTKKVFYKGIIHELLWFLNGDTNIKYLVDNGVNIWNDDAYRFYKEIFPESTVTKEEFIDKVKNENREGNYRFGDLGPVYGKQWRSFGFNGEDQIQKIINTLKTNPNDRRMICVAYNPDQISDMALPPCHVMFQFYTRELTHTERMRIFNERYMNGELPKKYHEWFKEYSKKFDQRFDIPMPDDGSDFDIAEIPKYGLSCMYTMRSNDIGLGWSFNVASYGILTYMIAKLVNMVPDELIASLGDCHIYANHIDVLKEQMKRNGSDIVPKLVIHGNQKAIEDFKYEDFEIIDYHPDPPIKMPLSVG